MSANSRVDGDMLDLIKPVSLIRYLIVWRVTSPLVILPRCLPRALATVLGNLIGASLPTQQARAWRKALATTTTHWPMKAVLFAPYLASKRAYGKGELIIWELKLMGEDADHGLFLELILPAMEKAGSRKVDTSSRGARNLWGHFDIQAVYVSRGRSWEPLVEDGRLNLRYHATPTQWAEGLTFGETMRSGLHYLTWLTPFEFAETQEKGLAGTTNPTLRDILDALMIRMTFFLPGRPDAQQLPEVLVRIPSEEQKRIEWSLQQEESQPLIQQEALQASPNEWPGHKIGMQVFQDILPPLLPYLELASILHIGEHTHLGCGTFVLT